ncbi:hypothetical protein BVI434_670022 [Burkholderia vietnamiensis]|nr:hypothetical protein BVI434_670022 [Burkholderia vietnamiensis]
MRTGLLGEPKALRRMHAARAILALAAHRSWEGDWRARRRPSVIFDEPKKTHPLADRQPAP